jgi:hypothetical protein
VIQFRRRTVVLALTAFLAFAGLATASFVRTLAPAEAGGTGFTDTPPWIAAHAAWLADNGIASGFPGNLFKPDDNITRGQAAFWFGNYNDSLELVENQFDPDDNKAGVSGWVDCPAGKRAIAGGGDVSTAALYLQSSHPDGSSWTVEWRTDDNVLVSPASASIWALCAPNITP